jgi:hypothetical protein
MKGLRRKTGHPVRLFVAGMRQLWMPFARVALSLTKHKRLLRIV